MQHVVKIVQPVPVTCRFAIASGEHSDIVIVRPISHAIVQISDNQRRSFHALKDYNWTLYPQWNDESADSGDWVTERFNLSAYAGDTVTIRFILITSGLTPADGWYIDSVSIRESAPTVSMQLTHDTGWNLVSLPVAVENGRRSEVTWLS